MLRIGVAIPIPAPWSDQLRAARRGLGDLEAWRVPPHITVLPPVVMERADRDRVTEHLARSAAKVDPFEVELRGTQTFRPVTPVVFVALRRGKTGCERLERSVRTGPLSHPRDYPYHPHVTVAHHLPDEALDRAMTELAGLQALFTVPALTQYVAGPDGVWRPLASWELGTGRSLDLTSAAVQWDARRSPPGSTP